MNRLRAVTRLDVLLQWRYGLYYAAAFVALVWVAALRQLPQTALDVGVPLIIFVDLAAIGFYFIAGMVLFEKGEQTLAALVVTPLRFGEYIASKLTTLTLLALVVSLAVAVASYGLGFNLALLAAGVALTSLITLLVGFVTVAPYRSISRYLLPSQLYLLPLILPLAVYLLPDLPVWYLLPTYGSLLMLQGAFTSITLGQLIYALVYQAVWIVGLLWLARRAFRRHVVARQGG